MIRWWHALAGTAALALVVEVLPDGPVRQVLALVLGLVVPGAALLAAAAPAGPRPGGPFAVGLAMTASCAIVALAGVALHALGVSITGGHLLAAVVVVAVPCAAVAFVRRPAPAAAPAEREWPAIVPALVVAGLGIALVGVLQHELHAPPPTPYEAYGFAGGPALAGTEIRVPPGAALRLPLTIQNTHRDPRQYTLRAVFDGRVPWAHVDLTVPGRASAPATIAGHLPADGCLHRVAVSLTPAATGRPLPPLTAYARSGPPEKCIGG